jgi:DNA-binding response OmpR family regulator
VIVEAPTIAPVFCPLCDAPLEQSISKGGLRVTSGPWRVFWKGRAVEAFSPMQTRYLFLLLRLGRVSHEALEFHLRLDSSPAAVKTHMSTLRSILRAASIPVTIQSIHGWGYELEMHE